MNVINTEDISEIPLTPEELLEGAELMLSSNNPKMYRASVLEAITALESHVKNKIFNVLKRKIDVVLVDFLEQKTRMDFETRLTIFIPVVTGLKIDKGSNLWVGYKKAKTIRNRIAHSPVKISAKDARTVIDVVYEWIAYLNSTSNVVSDTRERSYDKNNYELVGKFLEIYAKLERLIYSEKIKLQGRSSQTNPLHYSNLRSISARELIYIGINNEELIQKVDEIRNLRNNVVHGLENNYEYLTSRKVDELNQLVKKLEDLFSKRD